MGGWGGGESFASRGKAYIALELTFLPVIAKAAFVNVVLFYTDLRYFVTQLNQQTVYVFEETFFVHLQL